MKGKCPDCQVNVGEYHVSGCDVERCGCRNGGQQAISCLECTDEQYFGHRIPWSGAWPGKVECRYYGFWCRDLIEGVPAGDYTHIVTAMNEGKQVKWHVPCDATDIGAHEDLNRWHEMGCPSIP